MDEEGGSVALHTPVGEDACPVDYNEPAREAQRETAVADYSICGRLDHNRNCGFSGMITPGGRAKSALG